MLARIRRMRQVEGACVGLGGVGPTPVLLDVSGHLGTGRSDAAFAAIGQDAFDAAVEAMEDLNGSRSYRREMARLYSQRAVRMALDRRGEGASG